MRLGALRFPTRALASIRGLARYEHRTTLRRQSSNFMPSFMSEKLSQSRHLLSEDNYDFIDAERILLADLGRVLKKLDEANQEDLDLVHDLRSRIDDLFMVVVVGEFNAGKSTFINSLLGDKYLKSGILPTTDRICLLRSDKEGSEIGELVKEAGSAESTQWKRSDHLMLEDVEELEVKSADWLQPGVALVDTPGTNALMSRHEYLSKVIVPRADLILFVTSAERPMSESECAFLSRIADWGKKVVICLNKKDIVSEGEIKEVEDYVKLSAASRLQYTSGKVPVFAVSSMKALEAKLAAKEGVSTTSQGGSVQHLYESSGIEALETYLASTLGREEVLLNKLGAPLIVTDRLVARAMESLLAREDTLLTDRRTLDMVQESMDSYQQDLRRDTKYLREKAGAVFSGVQMRIGDYVSESITLGSVGRAMAATLFGGAGREEAHADKGANSGSSPEGKFVQAIQQRTKEELEVFVMEAVRDVADLMAQRNKGQASAVVQYVDASNVSREVGGRAGRVTEVSSGQWEAARLELVARLERQSKAILIEVCVNEEDIRWAWGQAKGALLASQAMGVLGASGFLSAGLISEMIPGGAVPGVILGTLGGLAATTGPFFAYSRGTIMSRLSGKMEASRLSLDKALEQAFEHELRTSTEVIRSSISPFERYVRHETEKVKGLREDLTEVRDRARAMQRDLHGGTDAP